MPRQERPIPEWAQNERLSDQLWIQGNNSIFFFVASVTFYEAGRGALVVDTTTQLEDKGHPFAYFNQEMIEKDLDEDTQRMVTEYNPDKEFVIVLMKTQGKTSTYRVRQQSEESDVDNQ